MDVWLWLAICVLTAIIVVLLVKLHLLRKAAGEIEQGIAERLQSDTNTLIDLSSRDKTMRSLAASVNRELAALRARRRQYEQGDQELKNAVTNISHDLRTPLTAICGYLELLEQEETSEPVRRYLSVIQDRAEALTRLTEELFRYSVILSAKTKLNPVPLRLDRALEQSVAAFYFELTDRAITPTLHFPEQPVIRTLDSAALSRVFSNLLSNAVRYSDGDLEIVLSADGTVTFSNRASRLSKVQVEQLFDRFYTVETARGSTGLGLAIAKTLVQQMRGTIDAAYENGRLSIRIQFPE